MCAGRPARVSRSQAAYVNAPIVTQIDGLLTPAECAYLVQAASDAGFEASKIEGRGEDRSVRTSRTAHLP